MGADTATQIVLDRLLDLGAAGAPVLRATVTELARLERAQERISSAAVASAILRDPMMTLRVLRHLYSHRTRTQTQDITTIAHAIMMLGLERFFREFGTLTALEDKLVHAPQALLGAYATACNARLAALFARDWALQRHDMDPEEVMVGALVHDVAEVLVVCEWPEQPPLLCRQRQAALRTALFARLGLPGLLAKLTSDTDQQHPRVLNVSLACSLARCCANGWNEPSLADTLRQVQRLLHVSAAETWERVRRVALQAAREWRVYGVRPDAAYLPMQVPSVHA